MAHGHARHASTPRAGNRLGAVYDARLVRRLWQYVRPHQMLIWISLGLLLLTSSCRLLQGRAVP